MDDNGSLAVDIRGTDWVRLEAEKRLSAIYVKWGEPIARVIFSSEPAHAMG